MRNLAGMAIEKMRETIQNDADIAGKEVTRLMRELTAPENQKRKLHAAVGSYVQLATMAGMSMVEDEPVRLVEKLQTLAEGR